MEVTPSSTAVIAVHMQHDIIRPEGAFGGFFAAQATDRGVVAKVGRVLSAARTSGALAVYTRVAWAPDYSDMVVNSPLLGMVEQSRCLAEGSEGARIVDELAPVAGDVVVTHQRIGGFSSSGLDVSLRSRGIDTVVFMGVATNASVEGTARQAGDLGYRVIVLEDACSAADSGAHAASIGSLGLLAEIATSADLCAALAGANAGVA